MPFQSTSGYEFASMAAEIINWPEVHKVNLHHPKAVASGYGLKPD
jgi:hypothetical protein